MLTIYLQRYRHLLTPGNVALAVVLFIGLVMAWRHHFIQDDAYISFRYAKSFAEGKGLVWYPGSTEYGYSNFLFTLAIGLLMRLGFAAESASYLISVLAYLAAIFLTFRLARLLSLHPLTSLIVGLALATNPTFTAYATGGLETSMQTGLVLAAYVSLLRWHRTSDMRFAWQMSAYSAAALLTRLDSALLLLPAYGFFALMQWRRNRSDYVSAIKPVALIASVPVYAVMLLLSFCYVYYGFAFPTSYYAKIGDGWFAHRGIGYLADLMAAQNYMPVILLIAYGVLLADARHGERARLALLPFAPVVLWLLYILRIGGDFMEFRLLVPIMPFFLLGLCHGILAAEKNHTMLVPLLVLCALLAGNYSQSRYWKKPIGIAPIFMESTPLLNYWVTGAPVNWASVGADLRTLFYTGNASDVQIALKPAGAIAYYSDLPIFDQLGLNSRAVLITPGASKRFLDRPGHSMAATDDFMRQSGAHLMLDHPLYFEERNRNFFCLPTPVLIDAHAKIRGFRRLLIPLHDRYYLLAYYLAPHPTIEAMIASGRIREYSKIEGQVRCGAGPVPRVENRLK